MSDDPEAFTFPKAKTIPSFAIAFTDMMFAHAEFEEQVRQLHATVIKTSAKRPYFLARLLRLFGPKKTTATLGIRATVQNAWQI
jgi:hypothetical protein